MAPERPSQSHDGSAHARYAIRTAIFALWLVVIATICTLSDADAQRPRTTVVNASEDTYIVSSSPDMNYGGAAFIATGGQRTRKAALVRFPLGELPPDARILSATLRLYVVKPSAETGVASAVQGEWSEMYTTWRNAPAVGPTSAKLSAPASNQSWQEADVASQIDPGGHVSFYVVSGLRRDVYYASRESGTGAAKLTIEWEPAEVAPSGQPSPTPTATPNAQAIPTATPGATSSPSSTPLTQPTSTQQPTNPVGGPTSLKVTPAPPPTGLNPVPAPPPAAPLGGQQGKVRFFKKADGGFDPYASSAAGQLFANGHYSGMLMYPPASDSYTWYTGSGFLYLDSYAVYGNTNPAGATQAHVLRDATGQLCKLGGQWMYAADPGNADFRAKMVTYITTKLQMPQYDGVYLDDVNLDYAVSCPAGGPIDPRTGQVMTPDNWKRYFVEFLEQIRNSTGKAIIHNTVWYTLGFDDPYRLRELSAADYVEIEFGFIDRGMTGGTGTYSWARKAQWIDLAHSRGAGVISQDFWHFQSLTTAERKFGLANYFLFNEGDYYSTFQNALPNDWDTAYDTNLGSALGARYTWNGLWRRDFEGGFVLVNPPGATARTVSLGGTFSEVWGGSVSSITLGERQGAVIKR